MVEIDGEVFFPMGGGISTARTNITHTRRADYIFDALRNLEHALRMRRNILKEIANEFNVSTVETDFKLTLEDQTFFVVENKLGNKVGVVKGLYNDVFGHLFEL